MIFSNPVPITDGAFQIRAIGARVTVLVEDGDVLLVDAGFRGSLGMIARGLEAFGLSTDQIRRVVVTHAHPDHSGGLGELVAGRGIAVAVHRLEANIIEGTAPTRSPLQNELLATMAQPILTRFMGSPVPVDDYLEDGDTLPFGIEVRVSTSLDTPLAASRSTCLRDGSSSLGMRCSTSSPGGSAHPLRESPSGRERRCGRLRSFSTWTSIPYASVTSHPCETIPAKPFERLLSDMPPGLRYCEYSGSAPTCRDSPSAPAQRTSTPLSCPQRRGRGSHGSCS